MDYSVIISMVAKIIEYATPFTLIFGITAKLLNLAFDMIFNKKIEM